MLGTRACYAGNDGVTHEGAEHSQPWAWLIVHGLKDIENRSWEFEN
jgi:hypothetical protein